MKKIIVVLALSAISSSVLAVELVNEKGHYLHEANELVGSLNVFDRKAYEREFKELETPQEKAAFFKKVLVAETSSAEFVEYMMQHDKYGADATIWATNNGVLQNGTVCIPHYDGSMNKGCDSNKLSDKAIELGEARNDAYAKHVTGNGKQKNHLGDRTGEDWKRPDPQEPTKPREPATPRNGENVKKGIEKRKEVGINPPAEHEFELGENSNGVVQQYSQSAQANYDSQIAELYAQTSKNASDIETLFSEVNRLDEKMDSVMAGTHAINNARPYLSAGGQTAVGVGVGYAGEAGSVAVGAAHSFTENWSASATLNVTTGSYSEVSGGAGVQYVF